MCLMQPAYWLFTAAAMHEARKLISPRDQFRPRSRSISKITVNDLDHKKVTEKITEGDLNDIKDQDQSGDLDL